MGMDLHDLIEKLRAKLRTCSAAGEPDRWNITIPKAELRVLLDAVEMDEEKLHLLSLSHELG